MARSAHIRVLYVDDNPHDRARVRAALESEHDGFRLTDASSRAAFEEQLTNGSFDLVLSDFNILGFDGLQVLDVVREQNPRLPVVIITATGSEEIGVEAMKRGAADYVIKTARHIQLLPQTIQAVLEKRRLREEREKIDSQLKESAALLKLQARIIDQIHDAVAEVDMDGIVRRWNRGSERMLGYSAEEMIGCPIEKIFPPELQGTRQEAVIEPVLRNGQHETDLEQVCKDGRRIWVHLSLSLLRDDQGHPVGTLGHSIDITERLRSEEELRLRQRALEASANGIIICNAALPGFPTIYVNPAFEAITGYPSTEVLGRSCSFLYGEDVGQPGLFEIRHALETQVECRVLLRNYRKDGSLFWNELHISPVRDGEGRVTHFVGIQNDVTGRIQQQDDLVHRANHDELTGLANRSAIREKIDATLADSRAQSMQVGVIVLNIDRLHHVNDTLGYAAGDEVLVQVAGRLQQLASAADCALGRIGGDEFLLVSGLDGEGASFESIARDAMHALAQPYLIDGQSVYLTSSAGVSWSPEAGRSAASLLGQADLALNLAKQRGRNQVVLYSAERSADLADRIGVGAEMRQALQRREMTLHYQPLIDVADGSIAGVEALMRWDSGRLGSIGPERFIPIAEDTGMIIRIGDWALRTAIAQAGQWRAMRHRAIPLSVNVSAVQFQRPEFIEEIEDALRSVAVSPGLLKIEITESVVMEDAQTAVQLLNRLRQLGVRISLDDFGTGYSSLGYLRQLPIDEIKIDQGFVRDVIDDSYAATLCRAIVAMSRQLQLTVVAEGVETAAQAQFLQQAGCQLMQGFLFSQAIPAPSFGDLLAHDVRWMLDGRRINPRSTAHIP